MELVSIIIPTYKRSDKLERAIKSALNQTYKNIEIIVVDDNSNEEEERKKTKEIVEKYDNIIYIENNTNMGGALTRNTGIEAAKGKYIAFLDDDDEFINAKIEKQMKLMKEKEQEGKKVAMVYCYKNIIDVNGEIVWISSDINYEGNCFFEHMKNCIETTSTWLCLKEALKEVGKFEDVKAHQDNILLMKILAAGYEIYRVPEVLLNFYLHNGNGITKKNKNYIDATYNMLEYKKKYYNRFTKKQIEEIEYNNSSKLLKLFLENGMKEEYIKELKKVITHNKFRRHTIRMILQLFEVLKVAKNEEE